MSEQQPSWDVKLAVDGAWVIHVPTGTVGRVIARKYLSPDAATNPSFGTSNMTGLATLIFTRYVFPFEATSVLFSSPAQWETVGRDWLAFASKPLTT